MPSLHTLILIISVIFIVYSFYLESPPSAVAGFILLAISFVLFYKFTISSTAVIETGSVNRSGMIIRHSVIPLVIAGIVIFRIVSIMDTAQVKDQAAAFTAEVLGSRLLQYSNEVELSFTDGASAHRAVSYISKKTELFQGDKIEIYKKPSEINIKTGDSLYSKSLLIKGIRYAFHLSEGRDYKVIYRAPLSAKEKIRRAMEKNINNIFDARTAPAVLALYFGNKNFLDKAVIQDFKRSGTLHILAASGMHLGIIASMIFFSFLVFRINKRILMMITLAAVTFYLYITDTPVSLLRAYMMFLIFSVQYIFNLEKNIVNTLLLSGISILMIYPYDLYDLGFQLSFGATLGILLFYRFYKGAFSRLPKFVSNTLAVTVSAQIMVLPIILFQLGEINLTGVLSNLVLIPGMSLTLVMSVVANILAPVSAVAASAAGFFTDKIYQANLYVVVFFSKINGHFYYYGNGYSLIPPYVCALAPLFPAKRIKKLSIYFFITGFIFSWAILLNFSIPADIRIAVLQRDKSNILLYKNRDKALIIGNCEEKNHADTLTRYILNNSIRSVDVYVPKADFNNLRNYFYLIKKNVVTRCVISPDAISNFYFKNFCAVVDNDGIKMEIRDFRDIDKPEKNNRPEDIYNLYGFMIRGELKKAVPGYSVVDL